MDNNFDKNQKLGKDLNVADEVSIKTKIFPEIKNEEKKQKKEENKIIGKKTKNKLEEKNKKSSYKNHL